MYISFFFCNFAAKLRKGMRNFSKFDIIIILLSVVVFSLLLAQNYPIESDDLIYRFDQRSINGAEQWTTPITSWGQLLESNVEGYKYGNGRYVVHCIIQLILSFGGYWILYVFSPILSIVFILCIFYLLRRSLPLVKWDGFYFLALLYTLIPLAATTLYGPVVMMINYAWTMAIYTAFAATYFYISDTNDQYRPLYQNCLLFLWGVLCGSWQESYCIGIAGAIAIYHLIHIRQFRGSLAWLVIGFGLGAAILVFAPGNFARIENEDGGFVGVYPFISQTIQLFKHHLFVWLWIAIGVASIIVDYTKSKKMIFVIDNWLWFGCSAIVLAFTLYTLSKGMMQGMWQLMMLGLTDSILLVRFLSQYCSQWMNSKSKYLVCMTSLYLLGLLSIVFYYRSVVKYEKDVFDAEFVAEKPDIIYDGRLQYVITEVVPSHPFLFEKICPIEWNFYSLQTMQRLARYYTNAQETWGTDIFPEPIENIVSHCTEENRIGNYVYQTPLGYLVIACPKGIKYYLNVHTSSKYPIDILKDKLKKRDVRDINYLLSEQKCVYEDTENAYYIRYVDWWTYNSKRIVGADIEAIAE